MLRFPPVMTRRHVEKAGYLHGFPHLLGCVCGLHGDDREIHAAVGRFNAGQDWTGALRATDLVLTPAACYPLYPLAAARGAVPARRGLMFDVASYCFRREATHEIDRLQAFRMREFVCMGSPGEAADFRDRWMARAQAIADEPRAAAQHRAGERPVLRPRGAADRAEPDRADPEVRAARSRSARPTSRPPA